jgi:hypothetical protein
LKSGVLGVAVIKASDVVVEVPTIPAHQAADEAADPSTTD